METVTIERKHNYKGFGVHASNCKVKIIRNGEGNFVLFTNGDGTSVTNASEQIATEIVERFNLDPLNTRFFENYPYVPERIDEVIYNWNNGFARNPQWRPADKDIVKLLNY
jgi:hypothetical protein